MSLVVTELQRTAKFDADVKSAPADVTKRLGGVLTKMLENSRAGVLRLHRLSDYKPPIFVLDVFPNHSWQVTMHLDGTTAVLLRLATHKTIDRAPR
jgi:hypothetical protein